MLQAHSQFKHYVAVSLDEGETIVHLPVDSRGRLILDQNPLASSEGEPDPGDG